MSPNEELQGEASTSQGAASIGGSALGSQPHECQQRVAIERTSGVCAGVVAVGTALSGRPPHRSQRAELPHWAPTSGSDAQTRLGIRSSQRAACRIRPSSLCRLPRHCVRRLFCWPGFPLVSRLPSTPSAGSGVPQPLFGGFSGTTQLSDFLEPFIDDLPPQGSRRGPSGYLRAAGSRISRFPYERLERAHGVFDHAGPDQPRLPG